jgi:ABC-type Fe2+-enterobactin transport system substrate-binding protein
MEMGMTLEQWIRSQMGHKRSELEQQGIERIKEFERRTIEARKRIESLPTR